jgi:hypothetical protein
MTLGGTRPGAPGANMSGMSGKARSKDGAWSLGRVAWRVTDHASWTQGAR